jgi:hypothetical protein
LRGPITLIKSFWKSRNLFKKRFLVVEDIIRRQIYGEQIMFHQMIKKSAESARTGNNRLSDGKFHCTYRELPEIFTVLDAYFRASSVSGAQCLALVCGNSLPEAILLLWMLYKKKDLLILPRGGITINLPGFCRHKVSVDLNAPDLELSKPGTYLRIESNPGYKVETVIPGSGGSIFLKTSGSTAAPKLVMHAHEKFIRNALHCIERFEIVPADRLLIPVPVYHMYGLGAGFIPGIIAGAAIELLEKTNIVTYLDREKQTGPTVSFLTPVLCEMLTRTRKSTYGYRLVVTAGDRITPSTFEQFETRFGKLVNLYGSTELGAIATSRLADPLSLRSQGIIETMPGVVIDFIGSVAEKDPGKVSEIRCRHEYGFDAYVDHQGRQTGPETAKLFRTKDLGKPMAPNRFQVAGRTGNSVNRSGILVAFAEVESLMEQGIEEIAHAVVTVSADDNSRGKKMIAWCQLKPHTTAGNKEIRSRCFNIMLRHMIPDEINIIPEIPRLPNGKFDRKKLAG